MIALTEALPKNKQNPITAVDLKLDGYQDPFINFKLDEENPGKAARGIAVYVNETITNVEQESYHTNLIECVCIHVMLESAESVNIVVIYRSPSVNGQDPTREVCDAIEHFCKSRFGGTIIMGDFNYPDIDWARNETNQGPNHFTNLFLEAVHENLLQQNVHKPTRFRIGQCPSLLDLVLAADGEIEALEYLAPIGSSDHAVLTFSIKGIHPSTVNVAQVNPKNYNKGDYSKARELLQRVDWAPLTLGSVEDSWRYFKERLHDISAQVIPNHRKGQKKNMFMNREAFELKRKKDKSFRQYQENPTAKNFSIYKKYRNQLRSLTRKLRVDFETKLVTGMKDGSKPFWKYCRSRVKHQARVGKLNRSDGSMTHEPWEMVNELSNFFSSVFTAEDLETLPNPTKACQERLDCITVTEKKVKERLLKLKSSKTPGPDGLHLRILLETAEVIAAPLTVIFSRSLSAGELPVDWKLANITPVYKKGRKESAENYRPISLTSQVCKVLETIIQDDMMTFFMEYGLLSEAQHGFVPGRSCVSQLLQVMNDWTESLDQGVPVDACYLDFKKAFDSVAHSRLIITLESLGIQGNLLKWIAAFLTGRQQRVVLEGVASDWTEVKSGVPQGSVLGPILFTAAVQSLPNDIRSSILIYSDDTKVYRPVTTRADAEDLQRDLDTLTAWSVAWQLPFNCAKCKVMHVGASNPRYSYSMQGHVLEETAEEKDLGLTMDDQLQFHSQTCSVVTRALRTLGMIKRAFANLDEVTLPLLYKTMVRPILEYGNCVWGPVMCGDQDRLERVQRRATRLVAAIRHLPYQECLQRLNLPSLQYRRERGDMITVYQLMTGKIRLDPSIFFTKAPSDSSTRGHNQKLLKPSTTRIVRQRFFAVRVINAWNNLPESIVNASSINDFKNKLDNHWSDKMFCTRKQEKRSSSSGNHRPSLPNPSRHQNIV